MSKPEQADYMIRYPFPLRRQMNVQLSLPGDLTLEEAKRLSAFIQTLVPKPSEEQGGP